MSFKKYMLIFIIFILSSQSVLSAKDPTAKEIIKKIQQKVENVPLIFAEFEQTFEWSIAGETQNYQGTIYIGRNEKFRIQTPEQLIVSNGKAVWTKDNVNKQVIIDHLDRSDDAFLPGQMFVRFHQNYEAVLQKNEMVMNKECYHLLFTPKNKDVYIQKLEVWVDKDDWVTKKVAYLDANDNVTVYLIKNLELQKNSNDKLFQFKPEAGFEVIDMR